MQINCGFFCHFPLQIVTTIKYIIASTFDHLDIARKMLTNWQQLYHGLKRKHLMPQLDKWLLRISIRVATAFAISIAVATMMMMMLMSSLLITWLLHLPSSCNASGFKPQAKSLANEFDFDLCNCNCNCKCIGDAPFLITGLGRHT